MRRNISYKQKSKPYERYVKRRFINYKLMLYFGTVSIALLFLTLSLAYFFSTKFMEGNYGFQLPPIFMVGCFSILISSYAIYLSKKFFIKDAFLKLRHSLLVACVFGFLFLLGQFIGWIELNKNGFGLAENPSVSYLYLISGLHALHVIAGFLFMIYYTFIAMPFLKNYVTSVVFFTDPVPKLQLNLLEFYWHFLGVVWLFLMVFFSFVK